MYPRLQNLFLNSLGEASDSSVTALAEAITLPAQSVLIEQGAPTQYVYLLTSGLASMVNHMPDGSTVEVGICGREGPIGASDLFGLGSTGCIMQIAGDALRIPVPAFRQLLLESAEVRSRTLEFMQNTIAGLGQISACNRLHSAEARLARWLLMVQDRVEGKAVPVKQASLAQMLGSRRTTITMAAAIMKRNGWISYNRGRIQILDRRLLKTAACTCYPVLDRLYRELYTNTSV